MLGIRRNSLSYKTAILYIVLTVLITSIFNFIIWENQSDLITRNQQLISENQSVRLKQLFVKQRELISDKHSPEIYKRIAETAAQDGYQRTDRLHREGRGPLPARGRQGGAAGRRREDRHQPRHRQIRAGRQGILPRHPYQRTPDQPLHPAYAQDRRGHRGEVPHQGQEPGGGEERPAALVPARHRHRDFPAERVRLVPAQDGHRPHLQAGKGDPRGVQGRFHPVHRHQAGRRDRPARQRLQGNDAEPGAHPRRGQGRQSAHGPAGQQRDREADRRHDPRQEGVRGHLRRLGQLQGLQRQVRILQGR